MNLSLNDGWKIITEQFGIFDYKINQSFYSVLLNNKRIENPHYGLNEYPIRDLCKQDTEYHLDFDASSDLCAKQHVVLSFGCIDTIAEITLNNKHIADCDNMFIKWKIDVKKYIRPGKNNLVVKIKSPIVSANQAQDNYQLWGMPETMRGYQHIRKAHCMYGWDWGPQLPDMGIYKNVYIEAYNGSKLQDVLITQIHNADNTVDIHITAEVENGCESEKPVVTVTSPDNSVFQVVLEDFQGDIKIAAPLLWWPNGYGEQHLYAVNVSMTNVCGEHWEKNFKIGLRTLTVSTASDKWGSEFCFVVNKVKIFAMGANYIPEDNLIPRISKERTQQLIEDCIAANYNTLRVWGGGYYPDDYLFDLCDEYGLLVWQDFMFACAVYNVTDEFEESVTNEFIYNIKRFRHHASLGLLCGNNEMELGWVEWDITPNEKIKQDYLYLYERLLPRIVKKYAPQTYYWPASPSNGGGFNDPNSPDRGDVHYWEVWHGNKPFEEYRKYYFRFCSEFGFEAFPSVKTLKTIAEEPDLNPFSLVMESHQKCDDGNKKILSYLADYYLFPSSFEKFVYASQLLQADAIRYGVEHFRRFRGRCMGAVYWQLNDIWPGPSWSGIDYYGRWKALHYCAKRFFAPVLLSAHLNDNEIVTINISNETLKNFKGKIVVGVSDNKFHRYYEKEYTCEVRPLSSLDVAEEDNMDFVSKNRYTAYFYYKLYDDNNNLISSDSILFCRHKHYKYEKPNIACWAEEKNNQMILFFQSDQYVKSLQIDFEGIDLILSDNYFDITSSDAVAVQVVKNLSNSVITKEKLQESIRLMCVYDIAD